MEDGQNGLVTDITRPIYQDILKLDPKIRSPCKLSRVQRQKDLFRTQIFSTPGETIYDRLIERFEEFFREQVTKQSECLKKTLDEQLTHFFQSP